MIIESLIALPSGDYQQTLNRLNKEFRRFEASGDPYLLGLLYLNRGVALKNLDRCGEAVVDQMRAREIFTQLGHTHLRCWSENNLTLSYQKAGKLNEAFEFGKIALATAAEAEDVRAQGCVSDTLARLHFESGDYKQAITYAESSINFLGQTECYRYLLDSFETKLRILWSAGKRKEAAKTFGVASRLAEDHCGDADYDRLIETFMDLIKEKTVKVLRETEVSYLIFDGYVPTGAISEIEISTNRHEGLKKGDFVIVEEMNVTNGSFAAIEQIESGECYLGIITRFSGCIGLQYQENSEPKVFNDSEVKILGKVIGYYRNPPDADGYYKVVSFE